jgi:hypothetical protein
MVASSERYTQLSSARSISTWESVSASTSATSSPVSGPCRSVWASSKGVRSLLGPAGSGSSSAPGWRSARQSSSVPTRSGVGLSPGSAIPVLYIAWAIWLLTMGIALLTAPRQGDPRARGDPQVGKLASEPSESQLMRGTIEPTGRRGSHRSKGTSRAVPISPGGRSHAAWVGSLRRTAAVVRVAPRTT